MKQPSRFIKLYHQSSTRYANSNRIFLEKFERLWKTEQPHHTPTSLTDKTMLRIVKFLRKASNLYFKDDLLQRAVMLETVAAVPGVFNGFHHHMRSLRRMKHDEWIKVTMDEAENERMHLMALMELYQPTAFQRTLLVFAQGMFFPFYSLLFMCSKSAAHRFVGYLEEEAVVTYTHFLDLIDERKIKNLKAPTIAKEYWGLPEDATLRDVILVIRADEADHRLVNHTMSDAYEKKDCDDYLFKLDIHNPWKADCIHCIESSEPVNMHENDQEESNEAYIGPNRSFSGHTPN
jgi:ubiquinol oxidase